MRDFIVPETSIRVLVARPDFCFCAYLGVARGHVLAGIEKIAVNCHWGLNFQEWGREGSWLETDWYWWGWDYGHAGDVTDFEHMLVGQSTQDPSLLMLKELMESAPQRMRLKDWTVDEIVEDAVDAAVKLNQQLQEQQHLLSAALRGKASN